MNFEYLTDMGIGAGLTWLGLHYATTGWPARTSLIVGLSIIGLAISAQNARFVVDAISSIASSIARQCGTASDWMRRRKTRRVEKVKRAVEPEVIPRMQISK